jgi:hypothetical protein
MREPCDAFDAAHFVNQYKYLSHCPAFLRTLIAP